MALTQDRFSALVAVGATAPKPRRKVIVQLKQYGPDLQVHQRCVDELRGTCLRVGASEAILITTSGFSHVVQEQAAALAREKTPLAPVHLVDGSALLRALVAHQVGVTHNTDGTAHVDAAYFDALTETCPGNARRRRSKNTAVGDNGGSRNGCNDGAGTPNAPEPCLTLLVLQLPLVFTYSGMLPLLASPKGRKRKLS